MEETAHGRATATSTAGAQGLMQFMPATFAAYGVDGDGDGRASIRSDADSVFSAANYLTKSGVTKGPDGVRKALYAYNHATWYVNDVLHYAHAYGGGLVLGDPTSCAGGQGNPNLTPLPADQVAALLAWAGQQAGEAVRVRRQRPRRVGLLQLHPSRLPPHRPDPAAHRRRPTRLARRRPRHPHPTRAGTPRRPHLLGQLPRTQRHRARRHRPRPHHQDRHSRPRTPAPGSARSATPAPNRARASTRSGAPAAAKAPHDTTHPPPSRPPTRGPSVVGLVKRDVGRAVRDAATQTSSPYFGHARLHRDLDRLRERLALLEQRRPDLLAQVADHFDVPPTAQDVAAAAQDLADRLLERRYAQADPHALRQARPRPPGTPATARLRASTAQQLRTPPARAAAARCEAAPLNHRTRTRRRPGDHNEHPAGLGTLDDTEESAMQQSRRTTPYPYTWEIPLGAPSPSRCVSSWPPTPPAALALALAGAGWAWTSQAQLFTALPGHPRRGQPRRPRPRARGLARAALHVPGRRRAARRSCLIVWAAIAGMRRWGPARVRGMATRAEAETLLGVAASAHRRSARAARPAPIHPPPNRPRTVAPACSASSNGTWAGPSGTPPPRPPRPTSGTPSSTGTWTGCGSA